MALICNEYECPHHGRFAALVERDAADTAPCPELIEMAQVDINLEYAECIEFQECMTLSPWVISAPLGKVKIAEVTRGKSDPRPPWALNTEALADGMPIDEWRAREDKKDRERRWKQNREALR